MIDKVNEMISEAQRVKREGLERSKAETRKIKELYKDDIAEKKAEELAKTYYEKVEAKYNKDIKDIYNMAQKEVEDAEKEVLKMEKTSKYNSQENKDSLNLEMNNVLLKISLLKENPNAIADMVIEYKDNKQVIDFIKKYTQGLDHEEYSTIRRNLSEIEMDTRLARANKALVNVNYTMRSSDGLRISDYLG